MITALSNDMLIDRQTYLYSPSQLKIILDKIDKPIKKSLGQNYLIDKNMVYKIVNFIEKELLQRSLSHVVEIGCGMGSLTNVLLLKGIDTIGVEVDRKSISFLKEVFSKEMDENIFDILEKDILSVNKDEILKEGSMGCLVVGNLPYNITTPILFHSFQYFVGHAKGLVFMMQKEVAERIVAKPGGSDYGRLTVMCQLFCKSIQKVTDVKGNCFYPAPKVESSVIFFEPKETLPNVNFSIFSDLVLRAFNMRRKKVTTSLMKSQLGQLNDDVLKKSIDGCAFLGDKRAQELSFDDFYRLHEMYVSLR